MPKALLSALLALTSTSLAAPVTSVSGPIKDWPAGETGEVQLGVGNLAPNNLSFLDTLQSAKVDDKGQFTLKLPDARIVTPALMPRSDTFKLNVPCTGTLKVQPAAALNFFDLTGYDSLGLRLHTLRLGTTQSEWLAPGKALGVLVYAATATRLTGESRCEPNTSGQRTPDANTWTWDAALQPGWNLLRALSGPEKNLVGQLQVTADAVPDTAYWHLHTGGSGLGMAVDTSGNAAFYLSPKPTAPLPEGIIIALVDRGGNAEKAGLKVGDYVLAVDGKPAAGMTALDVAKLIRGDPGTTLTLTIRRGDQTLTITAERAFVPRN